MKKFGLLIVALFLAMSCQAISLFPFFGDVVGDYQDGTHAKFTQLNIPTQHFREKPFWFSNIADADAFLMDVLPFSSYKIDKDEKTLRDGTKVIKYTAYSEDGVLGKDEVTDSYCSCLYLIQTPNEPLYVGIYEGEM